MDSLPTVLGATIVAGMPAVAELIGATSVLCISSVKPKFQASLQHFSAGIIITAIGSELFPLLKEKVQGTEQAFASLGVTIGFSIGVAFMYFTTWLFEGSDEHMGQEEIATDPRDHAELGDSKVDSSADLSAADIELSKSKQDQVSAPAEGEADGAWFEDEEDAAAMSPPLTARSAWRRYKSQTNLWPATLELTRNESSQSRVASTVDREFLALEQLEVLFHDIADATQKSSVSRSLLDMQAHMIQAQVDVLRRALAKEPRTLSASEVRKVNTITKRMAKCTETYAQARKGPAEVATKKLQELEELCEKLEHEVDTNDPQYRRWKPVSYTHLTLPTKRIV
eukprot:TRINITY_DN38097_c0_g1_i2.p1 TRINITY_DN38097_c0_g1~~TRINITY_DN38097_c0_g1_i2.p1  ORF type:complete len:340 (+),score=102.81 TRINITY_DN38097_c0_g1_i2:167-1186(+)